MLDFATVSDAQSFLTLFNVMFGLDIETLTNDELIRAYTLFQFQADQVLSVMGERGLITLENGAPVVPYVLPDGVQDPPTLLNGGQTFGPSGG